MAFGHGNVFGQSVFIDLIFDRPVTVLNAVPVIRDQRAQVQIGAGYRKRLLIDP